MYRSTDFGGQWLDRTGLLPQFPFFVRDLAVDPQDPNVLYALVADSGLDRSANAGQDWALQNALKDLGPLMIAVDPGMPTQLLLASAQGIFASQDRNGTRRNL